MIRLIQFFISPEHYLRYIDPSRKELPDFYDGCEMCVNNTLNSFDLDKCGYILLDSFYLRFDQSLHQPIDIISIIKRSQIINRIWCLHAQDEVAIHNLIVRRHLLYINFYYHPEVSAISHMLENIMRKADSIYKFTECSKLETKEDFTQFFKLTDQYFIETILNTKEPSLFPSRDLLKKILNGCSGSSFSEVLLAGKSQSGCEIQYKVIDDKSSPLKMLPKILYHDGTKILEPGEYKLVRRFVD